MVKKEKGEEKMTDEKKVKKCGMIRSERKIAKDGSGYVEKVLNIYGDDLGEVKKVFNEGWEKNENR